MTHFLLLIHLCPHRLMLRLNDDCRHRFGTRAGLAALGSRKKEGLCLKVDQALSQVLPPLPDGSNPALENPATVGAAKKAARTVITVLMTAYKHPEASHSSRRTGLLDLCCDTSNG